MQNMEPIEAVPACAVGVKKNENEKNVTTVQFSCVPVSSKFTNQPGHV
jgi:hypothetical protein